MYVMFVLKACDIVIQTEKWRRTLVRVGQIKISIWPRQHRFLPMTLVDLAPTD
jgi:hypothetical protein